MTKFIPLFPLGIVVYPTEHINLHIFEPRYKQLIRESVQGNKAFGMATVINNELQEYGCAVSIKEITKEYPNGEMDIKIEGVSVIRILEYIADVPDKQYSGAIVAYPTNILQTTYQHKLQKIKSLVGQLLQKLHIDKLIQKAEGSMLSYDFAHLAGLTLEQEYEMQQILNEEDRQNYLLYYLQQALNNTAALQNINDKVKLNGHFRLNK